MTTPPDQVVARTERRLTHRKQYRGKLEVEWGSAVLSGSTRDIGPSGLFVEMTPPLWVGATFRARLVLNPDLLLDCTVVRVEPASGIAVRFEIPEESGKAQLAALLSSLPQV